MTHEEKADALKKWIDTMTTEHLRLLVRWTILAYMARHQQGANQ